MVVQLLAGIVVGAVLASIVWGIYLKTAKNKSEQVRRVREELMHDLGELWVDIDTFISSFRAGMMDERTFKNSFSAKIDAINHLLKPNLHLFEVYYVKYMETLIKEYNRIVHLREIPSDLSPSSDFSSEMETSYAPPPEQTDLFSPPADNVSTASAASMAVDSGNPAAAEKTGDPLVDDKTQLVESDAVSDGIVDTVIMEEVEEDATSSIDEAVTVPFAAAEVSDEVDAMFEDAFSSIETSDTSPEAGADRRREGVPPIDGERIVATDTTQSDIGTVAMEQEVSDETIMGFEQPAIAMDDSLQHASERSLFGKTASEKSIGGEDFSMETLMDVDLNTIASSVAKVSVTSGTEDDDIEKTRHFELIPDEKPDVLSGKTELEVVIASDASHADSADENEKGNGAEADDIPEETTYTRAEELEKRAVAEQTESVETADEDFEVIIPDSTGSETDAPMIVGSSETSEASVDEDSITGDDVAEKIAALEIGSSKSKEKEPPAEKVPPKEKREPVKEEKAEVQKPEETKPISLKESEEAITGDDVADQIDSFFVVFNEE